jgi:hypothetical protein
MQNSSQKGYYASRRRFPGLEDAMRITILSLFLCAGTTAFCQSSAAAPAIPDKLWQTPLVVTPPPVRDFTKLPPGWHAVPLTPPGIMVVPKAIDSRHLTDAQIDPKIIVHPPASSMGVQPPGTAVAQNEYPHLRMLPIESAGSHVEAIPNQWPPNRLENIPTQWPTAEIIAAYSSSAAMVRSPGN